MAGNPWRELRARDHITLAFGEIDADGALVPLANGRRLLVLASRLGRRERKAVLVHELEHDTRGVFYTDRTPARLVAKEEQYVDRATCAKLIPWHELDEFIASTTTAGDSVTIDGICDRFDVPPSVAVRAVHLSQLLERSPRHPSLRRVTEGTVRLANQPDHRSEP